jgi:parvulin-like peptidyl-prolyl isomerase
VLLVQEARRRFDPLPDDAVEAELARVIQQHGGEPQFYAAIGAMPDQRDLIKADLETNLRVQKLIESRVGPLPDPADADIAQYYEQHPDLYMTIEEARASHVLKSPRRSEERRDAYEQLRRVRSEALAGADFDALAAEHTDKKEEPVDLGWFKRGELPDDFETIIFSMNPGEVSPVFTSAFGLHLLKVTGRRPSVVKPLDEVRHDVIQQIQNDRRTEAAKQLVDELQSAAAIEDDTPEDPAPTHTH